MKKFITERTCWHNGRYYEEGAVVECDCKFCKEGSVSYFTPIEEKNVSQETKFEEKVDVANDKVKEITDDVDKVIKETQEELQKNKPKKKNKIEIV